MTRRLTGKLYMVVLLLAACGNSVPPDDATGGQADSALLDAALMDAALTDAALTDAALTDAALDAGPADATWPDAGPPPVLMGCTVNRRFDSLSNPNRPHLHTLDPTTGASAASVEITVPGSSVHSCNGLATDPGTGTVYAMLGVDGTGGAGQAIGRFLATLDPASGVAALVGNTGDQVSSLTFAPNGTLYGIVGAGLLSPNKPNVANTVVTIDTSTAAVVEVINMTNTFSGGGRAIAFRPGDATLYYLFGGSLSTGTAIRLRAIDLTLLQSMLVPLAIAVGPDEVGGMVWSPTTNTFLFTSVVTPTLNHLDPSVGINIVGPTLEIKALTWVAAP